MQADDLPLCAWQPPRRIFLFPLRSRTEKVRRTAHLLLSKQGEAATLYWKQVTASNRKHLSRLGITAEEMENEQQGFFDAVQTEMTRIMFTGRNSGGAA